MSTLVFGANDLGSLLGLGRQLHPAHEATSVWPQRTAEELIYASGNTIAKFLTQEPGWLKEFQDAVREAHARGNSLENFWRDLSLWILDGHEYDAESCARMDADHLHAVRWAISVHTMGSDKLTVDECAKLAVHARSYGAAGVYLMKSGSVAVATAYSTLAALRDLSYVEWTLIYASTAMFARTWHSDNPKPFWPLVAAKALELVRAQQH